MAISLPPDSELIAAIPGAADPVVVHEVGRRHWWGW